MARESSLPCGTAGLRCALRESDVACAHLTTIVRPAERRCLQVCVCAMCLCVVFGVACTRLTPT